MTQIPIQKTSEKGQPNGYAALDADGNVLDGDGAVVGGGGGAGVIVRKFSITHATANLVTGATLFTPAVGDILFDAWVEITTSWDGTTPLLDVGQFISAETVGWFGYVAGAPALDGTADAAAGSQMPSGLLTAISTTGTATSLSQQLDPWISNDMHTTRQLPAKFATADPVKVCITQNGQVGGTSPGATQGACIVYVVTATPQ